MCQCTNDKALMFNLLKQALRNRNSTLNEIQPLIANLPVSELNEHNFLIHALYRTDANIIIPLLINKGVQVTADGIALNLAVSLGKKDMVSLLLITGASANDGRALSIAVRMCDEDMVSLLLQEGADPNQGSPLYYAVYNARQNMKIYENIIKLLIKAGADVDARSCLSTAAANGHENIVQQLIDADAKLDVSDIPEKTPLSIAVACRHKNVVEQLIKAGADVHIGTPIVEAAVNCDENILRLLIDNGATVKINNLLNKVLEDGYNRILKQIIPTHVGVMMVSGDRWKELEEETIQKLTNVVRLLIEQGVDVHDGVPLKHAAANGYVDIVQLLIDAKVDVNAGNALRDVIRSGFGNIVHRQLNLTIASKINRINDKFDLDNNVNTLNIIVQKLIASFADVNAGGIIKLSTEAAILQDLITLDLDGALNVNEPAIKRLAIDAFTNDRARELLCDITMYALKEIAQELIAAQVDIGQGGSFSVVKNRGYKNIIQQLSIADPYIKLQSSHFSMNDGYDNIIRLIADGAITNAEKLPKLSVAKNYERVIEQLTIDAATDINAGEQLKNITVYGFKNASRHLDSAEKGTPLKWAVDAGNCYTNIAKQLINAGADCEVEFKSVQKREGNAEIVALLKAEIGSSKKMIRKKGTDDLTFFSSPSSLATCVRGDDDSLSEGCKIG